MSPLLFILGPTASGKTALAAKLAERLKGEVISCDSQQVYRGLDIGTAKPDAALRARVVHHLLDVAEPHDQLDAAQFVQLADAAIADVRARGRRPIICGGTFLWARALRYGLVPAPPRDALVRDALEDELAEKGAPLLHAELARVDPDAAARIHATDPVRIIRALEVWRLTGTPISKLQGAHGFRTPREPDGRLMIDIPRVEMDRRIDARTHDIFASGESGILGETRRFVATAERRLAQMIGYREALAHLRGEISLAEAEALAARATRRYARRQLTWLRAERDLTPVRPDADVDALVRSLV